MSHSKPTYRYIDTPKDYFDQCKAWCNTTQLALDTEFMRSRTFYPQLALIQINDGHQVVILDPLAIDELEHFSALLKAPTIEWVLHSCTEDLEALDTFFGAIPAKIFDTQLAMEFTGLGHSVGYANSVIALEGIELPKGETRSNWLKRPLTESQRHYAAMDVLYLPLMKAKLEQRLVDTGHKAWCLQDCENLLDEYRQPTAYYQRINNAWKLTARQLATLDTLCQWREQTAKEKNKPRKHIVDDKSLWELAARAPVTKSSLMQLSKIPGECIEQYGDCWLKLIDSVNAVDPEHYPRQLKRPLANDHSVLNKMRAHLDELSEQLNLPSSLLCSKKELIQLVHFLPVLQSKSRMPDAQEFSGRLSQWRYRQVVLPLLERSLL